MRYITLLLLITTSARLFAQQEATTTSGEKVVLYENGTWKYKDKAPDTLSTESNTKDSIDCDLLLPTSVDKVTGKSMHTSDLLIVSKDQGKTGFGFMVAVINDNTIYFYINAVGGDACIDEDAKINILFTDGTRAEFNSNNDFNCDKEASLFMGSLFYNRMYAVMLAQKKVEIMRIRTGDKYVEEEFTAEQAETLRSYFECATAKTRDNKSKR